MLFYLKYILHDVEKLQKLLEFFFTKVEEEDIVLFDYKTHFPSWYSDNTTRLRKLESLLSTFLRFSDVDKKSIARDFNKCCDIKSLFENKDLVVNIPTATDFAEGTVRDFLNELFVTYLFEQQLSKNESTFSKKIGKNLCSHYKDFKDIHTDENHFSICSFCGIEPIKMMSSEGRPDYDHLLPKGDDLYVFTAVNMANLVAAGSTCNMLKSSKNLLYLDDLRRTRTISFYPFDNPPHPFELYNFKLSARVLPSSENDWKGEWDIEIIAKDEANLLIKEKIENWNRVYNVKDRYREYIMENGKSLIDKTIRVVDINADVINEVTAALQSQLDKNYLYEYLFISTESGLIPKRIFIEWALVEKAFLVSYIETKRKHPSSIDMSLME